MRIAILSITILILFTQCKKESSNSAVTAPSPTKTESAHPAQGLQKRDRTADDKKDAKTIHRTQHHDDHLKTGDLQWTTFDKIAQMNMKGNEKKFLVDVYTEWCTWCKVMDKKTFTDPTVQKYLEENFHIIKFDAERRNPVSFKGKSYHWKQGGRKGVNQLAVELLGTRLSYPTLVYLDKDMNKIKSVPGFKKPDQLLSELKAINNS